MSEYSKMHIEDLLDIYEDLVKRKEIGPLTKENSYKFVRECNDKILDIREELRYRCG